jgi:hypothetical protein
MSREDKVSVTTQDGNGIADRAGWFLDQAHPGPHKSKRVALRFGISPDMAKLLRKGRGWTVERLEQAAKIFGQSFYQAVLNPSAESRSHDLAQRVERLEAMATNWAQGPFDPGVSDLGSDGTPNRADHRNSVDADEPRRSEEVVPARKVSR